MCTRFLSLRTERIHSHSLWVSSKATSVKLDLTVSFDGICLISDKRTIYLSSHLREPKACYNWSPHCHMLHVGLMWWLEITSRPLRRVLSFHSSFAVYFLQLLILLYFKLLLLVDIVVFLIPLLLPLLLDAPLCIVFAIPNILLLFPLLLPLALGTKF